MGEPKQLIYYQFVVREDTTINDLLTDEFSIFRNYKDRVTEFYAIEYNDLTNWDRIFNAYDVTDQITYQSNFDLGFENSRLINVSANTTLVIPESEVPVELVALTGKNLFLDQEEYKDFAGFWSEQFRAINNDPNNTPSVKVFDESGGVTTEYKSYNLSVWVYIKALDKVKDITDFVQRISTFSTIDGGGSFSITLDGKTGVLNDVIRQGDDTVSYRHFVDEDGGLVRPSYFSSFLQKNDVVFIRFEKLDLETRRHIIREFNNYDVNKNSLSNQIYDMIGLIDLVKESVSTTLEDNTCSVTGKDLTALLSEDASYFYPVSFIDGSDKLFLNANDDSRWFKRNFITGSYDNFYVYDARSVKDSLGFIINQLSNLAIVPDDLFEGYTLNNQENLQDNRLGERRNQIVRIKGDNISEKEKDGQVLPSIPYLEWGEVNGIWQIIDVLVEDAVQDRRQVNANLIKSEGSLLAQINGVCQQPFVEFITDTYGDKFVFFARQQPFTKESILNYINENETITIEAKDISYLDLNWEDTFYTWYQIEPNNNFLGYDKYTALGYLPIVFLEEYANIFGNRKYMISDSYLSGRALQGDKGKDPNFDLFKDALINDLKFIIDITSYLPFTRKGTIVVNRDRRIKKGTFIRLQPTGEICYVTGVNHDLNFNSSTIDGNTSITVERCMIEKYIKDENINYFKIVDTEIIKNLLSNVIIEGDVNTDNVKLNRQTIITRSNIKVNRDVFNFFLQRKHFVNIDESQFELL